MYIHLSSLDDNLDLVLIVHSSIPQLYVCRTILVPKPLLTNALDDCIQLHSYSLFKPFCLAQMTHLCIINPEMIRTI